MRKEVLFALGIFALFVLLLGGAVWIADAPIHPSIQQAHLVLSDERIPH